MNVISLFSGAGGLDLGFKLAGHKIVWANDLYQDAVETYRQNIGDHISNASIKEVKSDSIPKGDIVIGGFPCQGFSVANWNRSLKDRRNYLYQEMVRIIRDKQPKYFVGENVKGLISLEKGKALECIVSDFEDCGYRVKYKLLNAADYGVPQRRIRLFFLGVRDDIKRNIDFPEPTHSENPADDLFRKKIKSWVTISEALKSIPCPDGTHNLKNHTYSKYKLRFNGYIGHRRVDPNKPAPTVTARGDDRGGVVVIHHPNNQRRVSARELATIQSFPKNFNFYGTQSSVYRQIANAVPPLLGSAVARML